MKDKLPPKIGLLLSEITGRSACIIDMCTYTPTHGFITMAAPTLCSALVAAAMLVAPAGATQHAGAAGPRGGGAAGPALSQVCAKFGPSSSTTEICADELLYAQTLDHFRFGTPTKRWQQRYLMHDGFWGKGTSPIKVRGRVGIRAPHFASRSTGTS